MGRAKQDFASSKDAKTIPFPNLNPSFKDWIDVYDTIVGMAVKSKDKAFEGAVYKIVLKNYDLRVAIAEMRGTEFLLADFKKVTVADILKYGNRASLLMDSVITETKALLQPARFGQEFVDKSLEMFSALPKIKRAPKPGAAPTAEAV